MSLRQFLYLNRDLVQEFLGQVNDGVIDETTERRTQSGKGGFSGQINAGIVAAGGDKSKEHSYETESIRKQVASSEFNRLHTYLEDTELVTFDSINTGDDTSSIRRTAFVEFGIRLNPSGLHQFMKLLGTVEGLSKALTEVGSEAAFDGEIAAQISAIRSLAGSDDLIPMIGTVPGTANYRIGLQLQSNDTFVDDWDLDVSILVKVQRVLREGEVVIVGKALGGLLNMVEQVDLSEFSSMLSTPEASQLGLSGDIQVTAPGAIVTPIAIFV